MRFSTSIWYAARILFLLLGLLPLGARAETPQPEPEATVNTTANTTQSELGSLEKEALPDSGSEPAKDRVVNLPGGSSSEAQASVQTHPILSDMYF